MAKELNPSQFSKVKTEGVKKVGITGGGTGGHVFPAISLAKELRERGFSVLYLGRASSFEFEIAKKEGFSFFAFRSGAIKNQSFLTRILSLIQVAMAIFRCLRFLQKEKPVCMIGVGGFVSVPTCIAAWLCRIPVYLQEQNTSVGIANRFLGKLSKKVFLGFEEASPFFPKGKSIFTGNPLREAFYASSPFPSYSFSPPTLLICGGSQGARAINQVIVSLLPKIAETFPDLRILHQTGKADFAWVNEEIKKKFSSRNFQVLPFIENMVQAYAKASLVVCRSGALTISELIFVERPALLIPYPRQGQNDQTTNAKLLEKQGAAMVVEQGENFMDRFWDSFCFFFHKEKLEKATLAYSLLPHFSKNRNSTQEICNEITTHLTCLDHKREGKHV